MEQRDVFRNATIGLGAAQLYSQSMLLSTNGPHYAQKERLAIIKSMSKECVPEEYRCRKDNTKCNPDDP